MIFIKRSFRLGISLFSGNHNAGGFIMNTPEMIAGKKFGERKCCGPETGSSPDCNHVTDHGSYSLIIQLI